MITMGKLADSLEILANEGAEAFYNGSLADDIVQDIQDAGNDIYHKRIRLTSDQLSLEQLVCTQTVSLEAKCS